MNAMGAGVREPSRRWEKRNLKRARVTPAFDVAIRDHVGNWRVSMVLREV